jgi:hypothetical protein
VALSTILVELYVDCPGTVWSTYIVLSSTPATEEIGAMGREIESRRGIGRVVAFKKHSCTQANPLYKCSQIHVSYNVITYTL